MAKENYYFNHERWAWVVTDEQLSTARQLKKQHPSDTVLIATYDTDHETITGFKKYVIQYKAPRHRVFKNGKLHGEYTREEY